MADMTLKDGIAQAMTLLGEAPETVFMGYNVAYGKAAGTLNDVPAEKLIEMPLSENLMMGAAIGMALRGRIPVVYFERFDFITNAMDAIVNHLDKLSALSDRLHNPGVIIRAVIGNSRTPLFTGPTHTQDFTEGMRLLAPSLNIVNAIWPRHVTQSYRYAYQLAMEGKSSLLVDHKNNWSMR